jgi:hypothetical protein
MGPYRLLLANSVNKHAAPVMEKLLVHHQCTLWQVSTFIAVIVSLESLPHQLPSFNFFSHRANSLVVHWRQLGARVCTDAYIYREIAYVF